MQTLRGFWLKGYLLQISGLWQTPPPYKPIHFLIKNKHCEKFLAHGALVLDFRILADPLNLFIFQLASEDFERFLAQWAPAPDFWIVADPLNLLIF